MVSRSGQITTRRARWSSEPGRSARPSRTAWLSAILLTFGALIGGCDTAPQDATGAKPKSPLSSPGIVRLKPEIAAKADIQIDPVVRMEFRTSRDFPGTVRPNENEMADITALVRGRVVDVSADLGQEVKAGTILALLNSSDLAMAQSAYLKAKAKLHVAKQAFDRAQFLLEEKVIGRGEFQRRQGEMISARAEAREMRNQLQLLGMADQDVRQLERNETIMSYVPIHAPFAGRIIARNVTRGEVVDTKEKLFVVADLSTVWVVANVPEKDIPYIHRSVDRNRPVEILLAAYPHEVFHGKITYVGDMLDADTRTLRLRVEVSNPEGHLKPEMFASVRIYSNPEPNVLTVPSSAVQQDHGRPVVFVQLDEQQFALRPVTLEPASGNLFKVLDGLQEGDHVVVKGAFVLKSELANQRQGGPAE